jgi:hypothetical protein
MGFMIDFTKASYIPMKESEKEDYMKRIEERVSFYQPKIEQKTGVSLGKVYVIPNILWLYQSLWECYQKVNNPDINEQAKDMSPLQKVVARTMAPIVSIPLITILGIPMISLAKFRDELIDLAAGEDCIRVPFGMTTRQKLSAEKIGRDIHLDEKVVHELSHILWNKLEDPNKEQIIRGKHIWSEGFATYCQQEFFVDLYPQSYKFGDHLLPRSYMNGKRKIEKAIDKYGKDILLQIPNRWSELNVD